jgi:hypothetical protein
MIHNHRSSYDALTGDARSVLGAVYDSFADEFAHLFPGKNRAELAGILRELHLGGGLDIAVDERSGAFGLIPSQAAKKEAAASSELSDWLRSGLPLQSKSGSSFHELMESLKGGKLNNLDFTPDSAAKQLAELPLAQVFLVQHDWASAFKSSDLTGADNCRLPFDLCAFEYRIAGKNVCAFAFQDEGIIAFVECKDRGWYLIHGDLLQACEGGAMKQVDTTPLRDLINAQISAIVVALDAEVAETELIRAPYKLNDRRKKRNKPPIIDYHIVKLARRPRPLPPGPTESHEKRRSPRLHFRRGHWAHFETHKTWRRWTLVGNPDLGFIDKHYRLGS